MDDVVWDLQAPLDGCNAYAQGVARDLGLPWVTSLLIAKGLRDVLTSIALQGPESVPGVSVIDLAGQSTPVALAEPRQGPRVVNPAE